MASVELLDDDRDTSLPSSALSPQEYRSFRGLVNDLDRTGVNNQVSLYSVLEFLSSFNGITPSVAQQVLSLENISLCRLSILFWDPTMVTLLGKDIFMQ